MRLRSIVDSVILIGESAEQRL
eukprot:COSAG02_NODE_7927_length_2783_cov_1.544337_6_plen_21_part_01